MTAQRQSPARIALAGVILGGCAAALATPVYAQPCDPVAVSMTPNQFSSCGPQDGPLRPPVGSGPVAVTGAGPPPPGTAPGVPPVLNPDGTAASYGQGGFLTEAFEEFRSVPSDIILGPMPGQEIPPPEPWPPPIP